MAAPLRVRPATPSDVEGIYATTYRAWQAAYDGVVSASILDGMASPDAGPPPDRSEWLRTVIGAEEMAELVAVEGDAVLGFAEFLWDAAYTRGFVSSDGVELGAIYVDPDRWGEGIGTRLLERGIEELPDGVERLALGVLVHNERAKAFYERRGFERVGGATIDIGGERYVEDVYARSL